ncbi:Uncharacterized protein PKNOH_S09541900 [Plasmodium knowlesi]|uniref:Uncharacterized protein n=1 Tax=Plasmodium knowlesi TaxID=5850 RepID=A0A1Y3DUJ2_PLAKN|nr:Uncharacterized protein PKNOH_S09541900 [Plasmodium knowlesi]
MNAENDQGEQVLNRKCSKRNFEELKSFDSVELLSDLPSTSSNKRGAISNSLNEFAPEKSNQKKQSAYQLEKNEEGVTPLHTAISNDELIQQDEQLSKGRELSQLAIIPFEGEYRNSAFNCKSERSSYISHGNSHMGIGVRDANDVKNIFHLLSKKDIFYKNLIKNKIKSNKPLMIKCDNLSFILNRNNYGGSSFPNQFVPNDKTSHFDENHHFANAGMQSSTIFEDTKPEQNLHHMNDEGNVPLFFTSLNEDSSTTGIRSNNEVPILRTHNNAKSNLDTPLDPIIPNVKMNMSENAVRNISPYPTVYPPDILNQDDGNYFSPDKTAQNNEVHIYNQHDCTNYYIPDQTDNFNTVLMSENQNSSESMGNMNSLNDVGNYYQANDYNAYQ